MPAVIIEYVNVADSRDAALVTDTNKAYWAQDVLDGVWDFYYAEG